MSELLPENAVFLHDGHAVTTSLKVAEIFGKQHRDVVRAMKNLACSEAFNVRNFAHVDYLDAKGENRQMFEITRDGFAFLVMGFTGEKAAQFKEAYIERFNEMEAVLKEGLVKPLAQVESYWFARRPLWPLIRVRVLAGEAYRVIAEALQISRGRVARAVKSMIAVGLLDPAKVAEVQHGPARKAAIRYSDGWGGAPSRQMALDFS